MRKYLLALLPVAGAACVSVVLRPLLTDFPALTPLIFLWAVAVVARYIDFSASIFAVGVSAFLLGAFFFSAAPRHFLFGATFARTAFFLLIGAFLCYLVHNLRDAHASRSRLAAIVDSSDDAIISHDLNGNVTSWNAAAERLFGYSPQEVIGRSILQIVPNELRDQEAATLRSLREGKRFEHFETERLRHDGSRCKVSLSISPLLDSRHRVVGASLIARDITDRVKMREAFIESEKLAATGRMAAAIAHEINNPLEAVTNLAFLIHTNKNLDPSARAWSQMLAEEINRISAVAKRSLTFFRDTGKPAEFDLTSTLDSVLDLNGPLFTKKSIAVHRDDSGPCTVFGSSAEMHQVFSNLIRNAIDAVGDDGQIRIRSRAAASGNWRITIADDGRGIEPDTMRRLFQPFVTTKGTTGNGLGLWISRGIVEKHGGQIRARTAAVFGKTWTAFAVTLPASRPASPSQTSTAAMIAAGDS
jgi:PAS domain S-box-containing protein